MDLRTPVHTFIVTKEMNDAVIRWAKNLEGSREYAEACAEEECVVTDPIVWEFHRTGIGDYLTAVFNNNAFSCGYDDDGEFWSETHNE